MTVGLASGVANSILDALCRATTWTAPAGFFAKLHTADPGAAGTTAAALNTTRKAATFSAAASGSIVTSADISWSAVSNSETYSYVSFWSASSGGTFLGSSVIPSARAVLAGDGFVVPAGSLTLTLAPAASPFGSLLPARIAQSAGATTNVATKAELVSALAGVTLGGTINLTQSINLLDGDVSWTRSGSANAVTTITASSSSIGLYNGRLLAQSGGSYFRIKNMRFGNVSFDPTNEHIKFTTGAHHVEVDGCTLFGIRSSGILITGTSTSDWQIWNTRIYDNGATWTGFDHGIYAAYARGSCVIANCLVYDSGGYNLQLYPDCPNLIVTCCTIDGPRLSKYPGAAYNQVTQGGIVWGADADLTINTINVGLISSHAPYYGFRPLSPGPGNNVYDSIAFSGGEDSGMFGDDILTDPDVTYTNCITSDPLFVDRATYDYRLQAGSPAIGLVQSARYGYVPATDIVGAVRVTADAGCYAA